MRRETAAISPVTEIIAAIRAGEIVVLVDDEDRENEGDLVFAAEFVTRREDQLPRQARPRPDLHADHRGARRAPRPEADGEHNRSRHGTNFTVSIEAAEGIATGISAHDRALHREGRGCSEMQSPRTSCSPGHIFPLIAQPGGVLVRAGHTEACCDLARLAGLTPAAVLCEIMRDDGTWRGCPT